MAAQKHLFTFYNDRLIVGGAVLFKDGINLYIGRIFIDSEHFHEGLGTKLMEMIENLYSDVTSFTLDTPLWNIRTKNFIRSLDMKLKRRIKNSHIILRENDTIIRAAQKLNQKRWLYDN